MKMLLNVGAPGSGADDVFGLLQHAGVAAALPSPTNGYSPHDISKLVLAAMSVDASGVPRQLRVSRVWEELALSLCLANLRHGLWGWSDPQLGWLLDFWAGIDSGARFVFVYTSPADFIVRRRKHQESLQQQDFEADLESWKLWHEMLLAYHLRHPDRTVLVNREAAMRDPARLVCTISEALGLSGLSPGPGACATESDHGDELRTHAANMTLDASHPASVLHSELDMAAALPCDLHRKRGNSSAVWETVSSLWRAARDRHALEDQVESLTVSLDTARAALEAAQHSRTGLEATIAELQRSAEEGARERAAALARLRESALDKGQADERARTLEAALSQQRQELAALRQASRSETDALLADLTAVKARLASREQELARVQEDAASRLLAAKALAASREQDFERLNAQAASELAAAKATAIASQRELEVLQEKAASDVEAAKGFASSREQEIQRLKTQVAILAAAREAAETKMREEVARFQVELAAARRQAEGHLELRKEAEEAKAANAELSKLRQHNELLLQQLDQVQEELQYYFRQSQELGRKQAVPLESFIANFWSAQQPAVVAVDLRQPLVGEHWYEAEMDGRWTGPGLVSTLKLPPVQPGAYLLEIDVVAALLPGTLESARVEVAGSMYPLTVEYLGPETFPAVCTARIAVPSSLSGQAVEIKLHLPGTASPAEYGEADERLLGARIQHLRLLRDEFEAVTP